MREWNAHIAMNVNKKILLLGLVSALFCSEGLAAPQEDVNGVVPSLYGVDNFLIHQARLANDVASANCGVSSRTASETTLASLKTATLSVVSASEINKLDKDSSTVTILPEVVTMQPNEKSCLSWVSLSVQTRNVVNLPPRKDPRDIKLVYWEGGLLVSTSPHAHQRGVNEALFKLSSLLSTQYFRDQPPKLQKHTPPESGPAFPKKEGNKNSLIDEVSGAVLDKKISEE
ncbi:MAG: hypothetical protein EOM37_05720 [Proteobacteria bacterium]|nr:hypothetical protein [Pseudomonadota bacterium]